MNNIQRIITTGGTWISICLLFIMLCATDIHAAVVATMRAVTGQVDLLAGGQLPAVAAKNGDKVSSGDLVRTKTGGSAEVVYQDGTILKVSQRSRVDIGEHFSGNKPDSSEVKLARGRVQAIVDLKTIKTTSPGAKKFEVRTSNAIAGVRGTDYIVMSDTALTSVLVNSGEVYVYNILMDGQMVNLTPGMITNVYGKNRPTPPRPALESDRQRMSGNKSGGNGSAAAGDALLASEGAGSSDALKAATQGISGSVASAPPLPPPPPPTGRTGSIGATWTPSAKGGSVTGTW